MEACQYAENIMRLSVHTFKKELRKRVEMSQKAEKIG